jgi:hypothetical protein
MVTWRSKRQKASPLWLQAFAMGGRPSMPSAGMSNILLSHPSMLQRTGQLPSEWLGDDHGPTRISVAILCFHARRK